MKNVLCFLIFSAAASSLFAQITVNIDTFGRAQVQTHTNPLSIAAWGESSDTFSGTPGTDNTWGQLVQYDTSSVAGGQAAFNSATEFTLDLTGMASGEQYSFGVAVGNSDLLGTGTTAPLGALASYFVKIGGTQLGTGQTSTTISLSNNATLNGVLAANDFNTNPFVYFTFYDEVRGDSSSVSWGGTGLTAVPEPSTYALLAGFLTLGLVLLRRRRRG
jgi:hypothetical protein